MPVTATHPIVAAGRVEWSDPMNFPIPSRVTTVGEAMHRQSSAPLQPHARWRDELHRLWRRAMLHPRAIEGRAAHEASGSGRVLERLPVLISIARAKEHFDFALLRCEELKAAGGRVGRVVGSTGST